MKTIRVLITTVTLAALLSSTYSPKAYAEQGYAIWEFTASKSHVAIGEEFTVSAYITGRDSSQYGRASLSIEAWYPNDPNPKGYEFVRFDASDSDFPVSLGQGVKPGAYNYQCRYVEREAAADMTGKHLFGRYVYKALNAGTYSFSPSLPCTSKIESLDTNWSFVWDYGDAMVTVDKPSSPTSPPPTAIGPPPSTQPGVTQSATKKTPNSNTDNTAASTNNTVASAQTTSGDTQTPGEGQVDKKSNIKIDSASNKSNIKWIILLAILLLPLAIWAVNKFGLLRSKK